MIKDLIKKLVKFGIVGFSGILVDFLLTYLFKDIFDVNKYVANTIGFISAASTNYLLNRIWTFRSKASQVLRQYLVFISISILGLMINNFIIWFLDDYVNWFTFYWAKLIAIGIVFIWNFFMNYFFNFNSKFES